MTLAADFDSLRWRGGGSVTYWPARTTRPIAMDARLTAGIHQRRCSHSRPSALLKLIASPMTHKATPTAPSAKNRASTP